MLPGLKVETANIYLVSIKDFLPQQKRGGSVLHSWNFCSILVRCSIPTDFSCEEHGERQNEKQANTTYEQGICLNLNDDENESVNHR